MAEIKRTRYTGDAFVRSLIISTRITSSESGITHKKKSMGIQLRRQNMMDSRAPKRWAGDSGGVCGVCNQRAVAKARQADI